ncbi:hypothetical protein NP493_1342g00001 [Ridgeia piscesae]|uniref:G-protein coupled receptors family 1 profile domain-containing protein n=1 Tax=Ridgeia piscesae TaxID=27915 RepID=A0AAD9K822_RIDPI|nr:hypothetical protein NP493_1342g00001 [Ridgeia piscesae]
MIYIYNHCSCEHTLDGIKLCQAHNVSARNYSRAFADSTKLNCSIIAPLLGDYLSTLLTIHDPVTVALLTLIVPIAFVSIAGNALLIAAVFRDAHMRKAKNVLLVNLAVADLATSVLCIPFFVGNIIYRPWLFGMFFCKVSGYMQATFTCCSSFMLTVLSLDCYLALRRNAATGSLRNAGLVSGVVWVLAGAVNGIIPYIRVLQSVKFDCFDLEIAYCVEEWPHSIDLQTYSVSVLIIKYVVPTVVIIVSYALVVRTISADGLHRTSSRRSSSARLSRKRLARMLIALSVVFVVSWMPYNVCSLNVDFFSSLVDVRLLPFTILIGHSNSALNPVICCYLNRSFRNSVRRMLHCKRPLDERAPDIRRKRIFGCSARKRRCLGMASS